jgi:hypothetical protein
LAAIDRADSPEMIDKKINVVSCFIDQFISRRVFNFRTVDYSTIKTAVFSITKKIRRRPLAELPDLLIAELQDMQFDSNTFDWFYLNQFTSRYMLHILSRITHFIEAESGLNTRFEDYVNRKIKNPFDIEHIWANKIEQHRDEFSDEEEFQRFRNKFGALLILPRDKNRSFQDAAYEAKLPMYYGENLLAKSLNGKCYQNNPQFLRVVSENGFSFRPYSEFRKDDIAERQNLYGEISQKIWDAEKLYNLAR